MFNKILMDEVLPYGLNNLLVTLILVFSVVSITSTLIGFVRQWVLIHLSIKIDIPLMLGYFGHIFNLPMKFFATRKPVISPPVTRTQTPSSPSLPALR